MGGLFSTSYDVQKVGQNAKILNRKKVSRDVIKSTETVNDVFAQSDLDIIGTVVEEVKKEDGKSVRIDETKTEVFEHVEVREEPPPPPISDEERKKQEDLMIAMVKGDIQPRASVSEEPSVMFKTLGSILKTEKVGEPQTKTEDLGEVREEFRSPPISDEERKKQEDLMVAKVIDPSDSVSEEPSTLSKTLVPINTENVEEPRQQVTEKLGDIDVYEELPAKPISDEERKKQEDLMVAKVIDPSDSVSEEPSTMFKTLGLINTEKLEEPQQQLVDTDVREELPPPPISDEERKKQEDLMVAMVIHPRASVSELGSVITAEEVEAQQKVSCSVSIDEENLSTPEEIQDEIVVENHNEELPLASDTGKQSDLDKKTDEIPSEIQLNGKSDPDLNTNAELNTNLKKEEQDLLKNGMEQDDTILQQIQRVDNATTKLKEKIINFSGTTKNKEYDQLYQSLVSNILKLDDISCSTDSEMDTERRRLIKILKQCMENLERKIEPVKRMESDSE